MYSDRSQNRTIIHHIILSIFLPLLVAHSLTFLIAAFQSVSGDVMEVALETEIDASVSAEDQEFWQNRVTYIVPQPGYTSFYLYLYGGFFYPFEAKPIAADDIEVLPITIFSYICKYNQQGHHSISFFHISATLSLLS